MEDRVVVVTGASRGIGRSIALAFAKPGVRIAVNYRSGEKEARKTADALEARGALVHLAPFDVADPEQVKDAFKDIVDRWKRIDILVNNAGITQDNVFPRMRPSQWDAVLGVNLRGTFLCSQAVVRPMMKQRYGRIINITSVVGFVGNAGQVNYGASKAGIVGLTRSLARELVSRNITVNAVAPGYIDTEMTAQLPGKARDLLLSQIPAGRTGKPEEVAHAVLFLASDLAGYITGQVIHVNGGMYMG